MNYYDVFGVSPTASSEDINAAHKALAKKYHPDINAGEDAHEKMTMLNNANEILSDNSKRTAYDNYLAQNQRMTQRRFTPVDQAEKAKKNHASKDINKRADLAEASRRRAENSLKNADSYKARKENRIRKKEEEEVRKFKQARLDIERQQVINVLSDLVTQGNDRSGDDSPVDEERHSATKVLLSMVRKNDDKLVQMAREAEEAERKQRIEEILSLVKEAEERT